MSLRDISNAIRLVEGSTGYLPTLTLLNHDTRAVLDLTDVDTATMNFRRQGSTGEVVVVPLTILSPPTSGLVQITSWPAESLDVHGEFEGEVVLDFGSDILFTVYPTIKFSIRAKFA